MSIKAMRQALEVLEQINQLSIGENAIALPGEIDAAMDNLRAAIEHYDQTALELCEECGWKAVIPGEGCLTCARQKAKPVAYTYTGIRQDGSTHGPHLVWKPEYMDAMSASKGAVAIPLYAAPRQWVELTDEEVHEGFCHVEYETPNDWNTDPDDWCQQFARYLEAKLKEKNHG